MMLLGSEKSSASSDAATLAGAIRHRDDRAVAAFPSQDPGPSSTHQPVSFCSAEKKQTQAGWQRKSALEWWMRSLAAAASPPPDLTRR